MSEQQQKLNNIESILGYSLPDDYKSFLLGFKERNLVNTEFCVTHLDGYKSSDGINEYIYLDNFWKENKFRDYFSEYVEHFELTDDFIEVEYLYHIFFCSGGSICMALHGQHKGKIYFVDNGDYGILSQSDSISQFLDSLFDSDKFRCSDEEIIEAVKEDNLTKLKHLIEEKDGNKRIEISSYLDIELFDLAYKNKKSKILEYLISKGFTGHNRIDYYGLNK